MSKRELVAVLYAQRLHRAHERRKAGQLLTAWEDLEDTYREEYLEVARTIQDALERHPGDHTGQVERLIQVYDHQDVPSAAAYWTRRISEVEARV